MAIDEKDTLTGDAALEKLRSLLAEFPIAVMITVSDGQVAARPIGVVGDHAAFDGTLWFITDRRSRKVKAINDGCQTSLVFQDDARGAYLHLRGRARVVENPTMLKELYTPVQRTWFPDGPEDPDITLIRFDATEGDYWDGHQSMLRLAMAYAKSVVTGSPGSSGNAGIAKLADQ
jgi:general stress protein 26